MKSYTSAETSVLFIIAIIAGAIGATAIIHIGTLDKICVSNSIIKHCELDLPRTQKCDLIAVPEKWNPDKVTKK